MAKAPADQFYYGDYIRDTRCLSIAARGAWADFLAFAFFETPQGRISQDLDAWSRLFGTDVDTARSILKEIEKRKVGDVVTERNGDITVTNRRKYREWLEREGNKNRQQDFRDRKKAEKEAAERNGNVTPYSSSSFSSSNSLSTDSYVHACVEAFPDSDPRLVEIAVLETMVRRIGSANEHKPIKSPAKYFKAEIEHMLAQGSKMGSTAIDAMLYQRRRQAGREVEAATA